MSSAESHDRPRNRVFAANIYISTLQLIAALLLLLMLLWHVSTMTLVENYMMPEWWVAQFLAEHANGWRVGVWTGVGVLVSVDCLHALLCLEWWCAVLHGGDGDSDSDSDAGDAGQRGVEAEGNVDDGMAVSVSAYEGVDGRSGARCDRGPHVSTASRPFSRNSIPANFEATSASDGPPYTHHPFLHPILSLRTQIILLSILDILMIAILAAHIVTYFVSLPTALAFCSLPCVLAHPDIKYPVMNKSLSMQNACIGLNMDIHVAGGFAVFMALVLGMLHVAALVVRVWECIAFGREGMAGRCADEGQVGTRQQCFATKSPVVDTASRSSSTLHSTLESSSTAHTETQASTAGPRNAASFSAEERSAGVRFMNQSAERAERTARRRAVRTDESKGS